MGNNFCPLWLPPAAIPASARKRRAASVAGLTQMSAELVSSPCQTFTRVDFSCKITYFSVIPLLVLLYEWWQQQQEESVKKDYSLKTWHFNSCHLVVNGYDEFWLILIRQNKKRTSQINTGFQKPAHVCLPLVERCFSAWQRTASQPPHPLPGLNPNLRDVKGRRFCPRLHWALDQALTREII